MTTIEAKPIPWGVRLLLPDDVALAAVEQVALELSSAVERDLTVLAEAARDVKRSEGDEWVDMCDPLQTTAEGCMDAALVVRDDAYNAFTWLDRPYVELSTDQALALAREIVKAVRSGSPLMSSDRVA